MGKRSRYSCSKIAMTSRHQVFVHDQLAAVRLAVETDVVEVDPPQLPRFDRAIRPPARAEFGRSDQVNGICGSVVLAVAVRSSTPTLSSGGR